VTERVPRMLQLLVQVHEVPGAGVRGCPGCTPGCPGAELCGQRISVGYLPRCELLPERPLPFLSEVCSGCILVLSFRQRL